MRWGWTKWLCQVEFEHSLLAGPLAETAREAACPLCAPCSRIQHNLLHLVRSSLWRFFLIRSHLPHRGLPAGPGEQDTVQRAKT